MYVPNLYFKVHGVSSNKMRANFRCGLSNFEWMIVRSREIVRKWDRGHKWRVLTMWRVRSAIWRSARRGDSNLHSGRTGEQANEPADRAIHHCYHFAPSSNHRPRPFPHSLLFYTGKFARLNTRGSLPPTRDDTRERIPCRPMSCKCTVDISTRAAFKSLISNLEIETPLTWLAESI